MSVCMSVCMCVCSCLNAGLTAERINLIFGMHNLIWSDCAIGYIILTFEAIKGHFRSNIYIVTRGQTGPGVKTLGSNRGLLPTTPGPVRRALCDRWDI